MAYPSDSPSISFKPSLDPSSSPSLSASPSVSPTGKPSVSSKPSSAPTSLSSVGPNTVFNDLNADGTQAENEPGLAGIRIVLYNATDDTQVASTDTDENGVYEFSDLSPGSYYATVRNTTYYFSPVQEGGNQATANEDGLNGNTPTVEVSAGEVIDNWNVGLFEPVTVGNRVWLDYNADGVHNEDEPGLGNITVVLVDPSGTPLDSTVSDPEGYYLFQGLPPGVYAVEFIVLEDYVFSPSNPLSDAIDRSDPTAGDFATDIDGSGMSAPVELESGSSDLSFDAGIYRPVVIGGTVFLDLNADGSRDPEETAGVEGATMMLFDANDVVVGEAITGSDGSYVFSPVQPGTYYAKLLVPSTDYLVSPIAEGGNAFDSAYDPAMTVPVTLFSGEEAGSLFDGGLYQGARAVVYVWNDSNGNGIQDEGEGSYTSDSTVNLYGPNDPNTPVASGPVGPDGTFSYDVPPGNYTVEVVLNDPDAVFSPQDQGSDDTTDSDVDSTGNVLVVLNSGEESNISAGVTAMPQVGPNCVFLDSNGNGLQDEGEPPLSDVELELYHANGTLAAVTTSDEYCFYRIVAPYVGDYFLRVVLPQDYELSPVVDGGNQISTNEDGSNNSPVVNLTLGFVEDSWNVALYMPVSMGNRVWNDLDGDGIQDEGEPGIEDIVVSLNDKDGFEVATTETDNAGHYLFEGLSPGNYSVAFELPNGYVFTIPAKTTANIVDPADGSYAYDDVTSDVDRETGATPIFMILSGSTNLSLDAGMFLPVTINGTTWHDLNADGFHDEDEPILEGSTVTLYDADGEIVVGTSPQVVGESGVWTFEDLPPGTYTAEIVPPSGEWYLSPIPEDEGEGSASTDFNPDILQTNPVPLQSGDSGDGSFDAGLYMHASVGDRVWFDAEPNGFQDFGEGPMNETVAVRLYDSLGYLKGETETTAGGFYQFTGLIPGSYEVEFSLPSADYNFAIFKAGENDAFDSDASPKTGRAKVALQSGESNDDIDAGIMDASPYYPDWTNDVQVCTNDGFDPAWLDGQKVNYLYSNKEACCKQHFWWRMTQCMANEEFKFYKSGDICDSKVVFEDWEENTPGMFHGTETTLYDTLDECCANLFWYDLYGCMSRSPVMYKFEFCIDIEGLVDPLDCQSADIYANVLEGAMNANADIGMGEVDANITRIGDVSLTKEFGSTVCGGSLEDQGFTNTLTGSNPDIDGAAGTSSEVCGVMTVEAGDDCKEKACLLSQFEQVKQALFTGDITTTINDAAKGRLPPVPELQDVGAGNLTVYEVLIPPTISGEFDLRYFFGTDLTTCQAKPTLAFGAADVRYETLHSCCVQHFNWDVSGCCVNGGGCPELPVSDAVDGYYPTWDQSELCKYKASFDSWEERFDTLEECCTEKFGYDKVNCMNPQPPARV